MEPQEVKELRAALGMTLMQMAVSIGVNVATVVHWEQGRKKPSPLALAHLKRLRDKAARTQRSQSA